jgi:hypothetical protein
MIQCAPETQIESTSATNLTVCLTYGGQMTVSTIIKIENTIEGSLTARCEKKLESGWHVPLEY